MNDTQPGTGAPPAMPDEDRIDRNCTHVIRPNGKLDSFCRYYSGFHDCDPG